MKLRTRLNLVVAGLTATFVVVLAAEEIRSARNAKPAGTLRGSLKDGTAVVLLYAPDYAALEPLARNLALEK